MSKIITIFGKQYQIPIAEKPTGVLASSPEWVVKLDHLTSSATAGFEDYIELIGFRAESGRFSSGSSPALSAASLRHEELILIVHYGAHATKIETKMNSGLPIDIVEAVHLGNEGRKLQTLKYEACHIQSMQQDITGNLILSIQISKRTNTVYSYKPDGTSQGQDESFIDYTSRLRR